jgi:hypothetical protein
VNAHAKAQLLRFGRLTVAAAFAEYLRQGGHLPLTWSTAWVLLPGTAETVLRQVRKVKSVPAEPWVTSVPAATVEPPGGTP